MIWKREGRIRGEEGGEEGEEGSGDETVGRVIDGRFLRGAKRGRVGERGFSRNCNVSCLEWR